MAEPVLAVTRLAGEETSDGLLLAGAGLGTSAEALWTRAAPGFPRTEVLGVDLPGHGRSAPAAAGFTVGDLAAAVRDLAARLGRGRPVWYAGVSLAGAVALQLATDPGPVVAVAALAAAATIGTPETWHERADLVRRAGTPVLVAGSAQRWFAPGFIDRDPTTANRLLLSLSDTDPESYARCCEALACFDMTGHLGDVSVPALLGPGAYDGVVAVAQAEATAAATPGAVVHVFDTCAHQPPAEAPVAVSEVLDGFFREVA
jgi:pimeloyl-ACP methyl ester carboxylesterase